MNSPADPDGFPIAPGLFFTRVCPDEFAIGCIPMDFPSGASGLIFHPVRTDVFPTEYFRMDFASGAHRCISHQVRPAGEETFSVPHIRYFRNQCASKLRGVSANSRMD